MVRDGQGWLEMITDDQGWLGMVRGVFFVKSDRLRASQHLEIESRRAFDSKYDPD